MRQTRSHLVVFASLFIAVGCFDSSSSGPGVTTGPVSGTTTDAGGAATFTLALKIPPTASVTLALSSTDANEGVPSPASLQFDETNWDVPQTVTVTGVDDFVADGDVPFAIAL